MVRGLLSGGSPGRSNIFPWPSNRKIRYNGSGNNSDRKGEAIGRAPTRTSVAKGQDSRGL